MKLLLLLLLLLLMVVKELLLKRWVSRIRSPTTNAKLLT